MQQREQRLILAAVSEWRSAFIPESSDLLTLRPQLLLPPQELEDSESAAIALRLGSERACIRISVSRLHGPRRGARSTTAACESCGAHERNLRAPATGPRLRFYCSGCLPFQYESIRNRAEELDLLITALVSSNLAYLRQHHERMTKHRSERVRKVAARRWLTALDKVRRRDWKLTRKRRKAIEQAKMTRLEGRKEAG